ncbi:hypothetical protein SAMN04487996_117148 [Dyadobacter soli]|uniref:Uncharacterized protein n=1 Tax=Dyadobacter soli TaxID=659014 RepID=A0A1G7TA61_9BACT|nr:hypothetical protein [Dyadobacter soli]SDG32213.1 hypothetical protein SAMN04487996_117148 [Dyadobacter soli]
MAFRLRSQLSENQIESDVASYLGCITPIWSARFRLISVNEQLTGADKLFNRFLPIYMQFKVSQGLKPERSFTDRIVRTPLTRIIQYREENNLSGNPILYFQLRRQARMATDFQHNILFKLNQPPDQFSLYIAPLTLNDSEYYKLMHPKWYMRLSPFDPFLHRELAVHDAVIRKNILLGNNPFLRHHISIPPHTLVDTHEHHYSYSQTGGDVAWHGGELRQGDFRLSTQMNRILNYFYNSSNIGFTAESFAEFIVKFRQENGMSEYTGRDNDARVDTIRNFAYQLLQQYGITLMLLGDIEG